MGWLAKTLVGVLLAWAVAVSTVIAVLTLDQREQWDRIACAEVAAVTLQLAALEVSGTLNSNVKALEDASLRESARRFLLPVSEGLAPQVLPSSAEFSRSSVEQQARARNFLSICELPPEFLEQFGS